MEEVKNPVEDGKNNVLVPFPWKLNTVLGMIFVILLSTFALFEVRPTVMGLVAGITESRQFGHEVISFPTRTSSYNDEVDFTEYGLDHVIRYSSYFSPDRVNDVAWVLDQSAPIPDKDKLSIYDPACKSPYLKLVRMDSLVVPGAVAFPLLFMLIVMAGKGIIDVFAKGHAFDKPTQVSKSWSGFLNAVLLTVLIIACAWIATLIIKKHLIANGGVCIEYSSSLIGPLSYRQ